MATEEQPKASLSVQIKVDQQDLDEYRELDKDSVEGSDYGHRKYDFDEDEDENNASHVENEDETLGHKDDANNNNNNNDDNDVDADADDVEEDTSIRNDSRDSSDRRHSSSGGGTKKRAHSKDQNDRLNRDPKRKPATKDRRIQESSGKSSSSSKNGNKSSRDRDEKNSSSNLKEENEKSDLRSKSKNSGKDSTSKDNSKSSTGSKQSSDRDKQSKDKSKEKDRDRPHKKSSVNDRRRRSTSRGRVRSPERIPVVGGDKRDRGFKRGGGPQRGGYRRNFSPDRNRRSSSRDNKRRTRPFSPPSRSPIRRSPELVRPHIMNRGGGASASVVNDMMHRNRLDMNRDRVRPMDRGVGSIRNPPPYISSQHDLIRRQREESERLAREQRQLLIEREKFEREKAQFLRAERERTAAERERLARDREELASKRQTSQYGLSSKDETVRMIPAISRDRDNRDVDSGYNRNNQYRSYNNQSGSSHIKSLDDQMDYNSPRYRSRRF